MSKNAGGVSLMMFIAGIVIAILVSSALSTVIAIQFAVGPQGPIGLQGPKATQETRGLKEYKVHLENKVLELNRDLLFHPLMIADGFK